MMLTRCILGGGILTVGYNISEQSKAEEGTLGNLNIWNFDIGSNEVKRMSYGCDKKQGNVISWRSFLSRDKTNIRTPATCKNVKGKSFFCSLFFCLFAQFAFLACFFASFLPSDIVLSVFFFGLKMPHFALF
jgi:hypothetical protein